MSLQDLRAWLSRANRPYVRERDGELTSEPRLAGYYIRDRVVWPNRGPNRHQRRKYQKTGEVW